MCVKNHLKMDNQFTPGTNTSSTRRKSNLFPNFLRSNANSREVLNSSDSLGMLHFFKGTITIPWVANNFLINNCWMKAVDHDPVPSAEFYEENALHSPKSRPTFEDFQNSVKVNFRIFHHFFILHFFLNYFFSLPLIEISYNKWRAT